MYEPLPQSWSVLGSVECEVNARPNVAARVSQVMPGPSVNDYVNRVSFGNKQCDRVGQLDFSACTRLDPAQRIENRAIKQITTGGRVVGRRVLGLRLLDHARDLEDIGVDRIRNDFDGEDAVRAHLLARNLDRAQHGPAAALPNACHYLEDAAGRHQIVGKEHGNARLILVEHLLHLRNRVPKAQRLLLNDGFDIEESGRDLHLLEKFELALLAEVAFEHLVFDEVRDDAVFTRRGDDHESLGTRGRGLAGHEFDTRCVDYGQELFRHRFRRGKKACPHPCCWNTRSPEDALFGHVSLPACSHVTTPYLSGTRNSGTAHEHMVNHVSVHGNGPLTPALDAKRLRRREISTRRREIPHESRSADAAALTEHVAEIGLSGQVVCAYVPCGTEPGSIDFVNSIAAACAELLLPVVTGPRPLDWAAYTGPESLAPAEFGLLEPVGRRLGAAAISRATVVLIPALAVDRRGVRLGRGGGHYDRSLPLAQPAARLIAVVYDAEVVDELPSEPHDIRVGWALSPRRGQQQLE